MSTTHSCLYINKDPFSCYDASCGKEPSQEELYDMMAFNTTLPLCDDRRERRGESMGYCTLRAPKRHPDPSIPTCISLFLNEPHKDERIHEPKRSNKVTSWWSRTVSCKLKKPFGKSRKQQEPLRLAEHAPVWFTQFSSNPSLTRTR